MICPTCGAYVDQGLTTCPHCQGPLSPDPIKPTSSKSWLKGCSACGCGCLVVLLIIFGIFGYGIYQVWRGIEQQMETEPLPFEQVRLDDEAVSNLEDTFAEISDAIEQNEQKTFKITMNEDEFNYLIQKLLKDESLSFQNKLLLGVTILEDNWLNWKFSFKYDENKYLNGTFTCFMKLNDNTGEFNLREFRLGNFSLSNEDVGEINRNVFTNNNIDEFIKGYNQPSEVPITLKQLYVEDMEIFLILQTKSK